MFFFIFKIWNIQKYDDSKNIKLRATAVVVAAARSVAVLRCHGLRSAQRWPLCKSLIRRPPPGSSLEQEIHRWYHRWIHCMPIHPRWQKTYTSKIFMEKPPTWTLERKCVTTDFMLNVTWHSKTEEAKTSKFYKSLFNHKPLRKNIMLQGNEEQRSYWWNPESWIFFFTQEAYFCPQLLECMFWCLEDHPS